MNVNNGEPLGNNIDMWYAGEPNGERMENCVSVWLRRNAWNDLNCNDYRYGFCFIEARPRFKMRG